MPETTKRDLIVKLSDGKTMYLTCREKLGLTLSTLTKRNIWSEGELLIKECHSNFDAFLSKDDILHMLYQDKSGNIMYGVLESMTIVTKTILSSKKPSFYNKQLRVIPINGIIFFFYVIEYNDNLLLSYQTLKDGTLSEPKVIDYAVRKDPSYSVATDGESLIILYLSYDKSFNQIGIRKFDMQQMAFSNYTILTSSQHENDIPSIAFEMKNILLLWQRQRERQNELAFMSIKQPEITTGKFAIIQASNYPFANNSFLYANGKIIAFWIRENMIYHSVSEDNGAVWSKPEKYVFSVNKPVYIVRYLTNYSPECQTAQYNLLPISFMNGLKSAFVEEFVLIEPETKTANLEKMLFDTLKSVSNGIDESNAKIATLERELTKVSIKLSLVETEVLRQKQELSRLRSAKDNQDQNSEGAVHI